MAKARTNPLRVRLIGKPTRKPLMVTKKTENLALTNTTKAREILKEHPKLILDFKEFIKAELPIFIFEKKYKFEKTENKDAFFIIAKDKKQNNHRFYIERILRKPTEKEKWSSHAYNKVIIINELKKAGINTVPVEFAFVNKKKGESYIAYKLSGLMSIEEARQTELISKKQYEKFKDNIVNAFANIRDKIKARNGNIGMDGEALSFRFFKDNHYLVDPVTNKLYVFSPTVESTANRKAELDKLKSKDIYAKFIKR